MLNKKPACLFDLDCTLNHLEPVKGGLPIKGALHDSFIAVRTLELLADISQKAEIIIATGRAKASIEDFETHFADAGIKPYAWILEHGSIVLGKPEWQDKVLKDINLTELRDKIETVIQEKSFPIDVERYRHNRKGVLLFSGKGAVLAEHFIDSIAHILEDRFRTIAGKRKITLIPKQGDKFNAFFHNFGKTHNLLFAAGDQPDDLSMLRKAAFPLTTSDAVPIVQQYINKRGGFVSSKKAHQGTFDILESILYQLNKCDKINYLPDLRFPVEEAEDFRFSRQAYLNLLFSKIKFPDTVPDKSLIKNFAYKLKYGRNMVIEVRMRDWGGEYKPLLAILDSMALVLPYLKWRLVFRKERLGIENLKSFDSIIKKLFKYQYLPDNLPRFSVPGVPETPYFSEPSSLVLHLYDHPEDLYPFYDLAMTRLITKYPNRPGHWFINPMYLKVAQVCVQKDSAKWNTLFPSGVKIMMAANIVDDIDIQIAVHGFKKLMDIFNILIIAPRVINNKSRNRKIEHAVNNVLGEEVFFLSKLKVHNRSVSFPKVLFIDSYGDLETLYSICKITYLGGGFNIRKRGFDPIESLCFQVPVVLGPIYDYNRISVEALKNSGWINVIKNESSPIDYFVSIVRHTIKSPPDLKALKSFIKKRALDPLRVTSELLSDLTGYTDNGYLLPENSYFPRDHINPEYYA